MRWIKVGWVVPALVLLLSLLVTHELWQDAKNSARLALHNSFDFLVRETQRRIEQRMTAYEQVLRGTVGLFAASDDVTRKDFNTYIANLRLEEYYPGIQGIGFSVLLPPSQREAHVKAVRDEGFPEYDITPHGERNVYTSILYLEPFSGRNLRAFGYDMYSESQRRAAMERARDTGKAAVSGKVTLVQETGEDMQTGFLMYLPVYRKGVATETIEQRRANFVGWVFAPFRMNDLMAGLQGEQAADLDIEIYDGEAISPETKTYDAVPNHAATNTGHWLISITGVDIGERRWTIATAAMPALEQRFDYDRSPLIVRGGISISLLLTLLIWLFLDDRARALQSARQAMHLALYDVLTGLPNRKLISERLGQALATARREKARVALMFIDLDKFKPVNDDFGHAVGDLLLREVAQRLQACMRESDTAARLGGDEFVALLPRIDGKEGARVVALKILHALAQPFEIAGHSFEISASIGVAFYPEDGNDEKILMKNADAAMYHAKNSGRNGVSFFQQGMSAAQSGRQPAPS